MFDGSSFRVSNRQGGGVVFIGLAGGSLTKYVAASKTASSLVAFMERISIYIIYIQLRVWPHHTV